MSTFVSYAQNFEDVILHRVLSDVRQGFYVDVGAQHPLRDSVTRAFYERGWRGVNIEPVAEWYGLLQVDRPEDTNLRVAIGAAAGEVAFYEVHESGLSTTDATVAAKHALDGFEVSMRVVEMTTLDAILASHDHNQIHFLKIDVEGGEADVLSGISLERHRPWIIVVEATLPNTQVEVAATWESTILAARYAMVYHDGLNRFYLAEEHLDLQPRFAYPPNFFDNFVRHSDWERAELARRLSEESEARNALVVELNENLEEVKAANEDALSELADAEARIASMASELEAASRRIEAMHADRSALEHQLASLSADCASQREWKGRAEALERRLNAVLASRSWRITSPLRWLTELLGASRPFPSTGAPAPANGPQGTAASTTNRWNPSMPRVPDESRLLELASRRPQGEAKPLQVQPPPPFNVSRIDAVLEELRSLSYPPRGLPPRLERLPGSSVVKSPILRVYERLFRKQALINERMAEALRLLRDNQRNS